MRPFELGEVVGKVARHLQHVLEMFDAVRTVFRICRPFRSSLLIRGPTISISSSFPSFEISRSEMKMQRILFRSAGLRFGRCRVR